MVEARLTDELKLILYDTDKEKEIKSFPKKGTDPAKREAAEAKFKAMKENIRTIVSSQKNLLKNQFLSGSKTSAGEWEKNYLTNPVLMRIAQLLVWDQGKNFFTVREGKTILPDGSGYTLTKEKIGVAHPIYMTDEQVTEWQNYFLSNNLKQLFAQVWEPVAFRNEKDIRPDRYKDCRITVGHILSLEKQDLVSYRYSWDTLTDFQFAGAMTLTGSLERAGHYFTEQGPDNEIILGEIRHIHVTEPRKLNRVIAYLDKRIVPDKIRTDEDGFVRNILPGQTLAQISEYLKQAIECKAEKCTALLLDYRNEHYPDYANVEEFSLD